MCGYRLRLHFDGYSECHDFWVNANSPDIHPAGWFEKTGHKLQLPKGKLSLAWSLEDRESQSRLLLPLGHPATHLVFPLLFCFVFTLNAGQSLHPIPIRLPSEAFLNSLSV